MKKIEERYVVIKISDLESATREGFLEPGALSTIKQIVKDVSYFRRECGKHAFRAIVVENDWPEYPIVHEALESRINEKPAVIYFHRAAKPGEDAKSFGYTSHCMKMITGDPGPLQIDEFAFSGVISQGLAYAKAVKKVPGCVEDPDIKVFNWADVDMKKWFNHTHCINWLSACPKCKTAAARVKSTSVDSNHLLDNDTVECMCCGNAGHIEIFNSDADVAWDVADGE